jgi:hypothetical protein
MDGMTHEAAMNHPLAPEAFELRPCNEEKPTLLDEDPVTTDWPTPSTHPHLVVKPEQEPSPKRSRFVAWLIGERSE